ncbi:MAG: nucleotide exchange factor GrpE [Pyrinomonadaceae bacterium]
MSEKDFIEEMLDGDEFKVSVNDKRRFNSDGERIADDPDVKNTEPVKSQKERELEEKLKAETERREAAEAKLVGVQAKFEEAKSGLERETAEMRERLKKSLESKAKQEQFNFLEALLPVLDNLNRAIAASETDPDIEHLRTGVIGTARSFEQALSSVGVEAVPSVGANFDPELHEAVDMLPVDPENDGKVTAEYSKGYKIRNQLLRPARVQVGKAMANAAVE